MAIKNFRFRKSQFDSFNDELDTVFLGVIKGNKIWYSISFTNPCSKQIKDFQGYTNVFSQKDTNVAVFNKVRPLIDTIKTNNIFIMGYGRSGSGKTYTLLGDENKSVNNNNNLITGKLNDISGTDNLIMSGINNTINEVDNTLVIGKNNNIDTTLDSIVYGTGHDVSGNTSLIFTSGLNISFSNIIW